ncbi:propanediol utilization protein [Paracoccus sp. PAR01]|uniref:propanediol utilization protein n=1 Tax=Paracoccus sp. PAR01 TaxID=2769282 RepID=UPI0017875881|nr:propanediol utilization protein [Paracoccus sp. PAR01]MBD9529375.1 propanediol utilization protein [Paracoccus sp. PAR01]
MIRVEGHFGEWLQGRLGPQGPVVLVTMACPALAVVAERLGSGERLVEQQPQIIPESHAAQVFDWLGCDEGAYRLIAGMPPGGGAGASTAALLALARIASGDAPPDPKALARMCHGIEGACDPLMLPRPDAVLWASRHGAVVEDMPPPPEAEILGGFWGAAQRTDPLDLNFPDISDLVAEWRGQPDLAQAAALASQSAMRCSALRGPEGDPTPDLAREFGALGHVRAHTGSARGLIFPPGEVPSRAAAALRAAGFQQILSFRSGGWA